METRRSDVVADSLKQNKNMYGSQAGRISSMVVGPRDMEVWFLLVQVLLAINVRISRLWTSSEGVGRASCGPCSPVF